MSKILSNPHQIEDLIRLFNQTFLKAENTQLICCEPEPIYRPANANSPHHRIIFAHGFYASALHEIAHWCVAGPQRRLLEDFGYWYQPDGRSEAQQAEFEKVEIKPQALEWIFSTAAGFPFHFSADNLNNACGPSQTFKLAVQTQIHTYLAQGLPSRANQWVKTLQDYYQTPKLTSTDFLI